MRVLHFIDHGPPAATSYVRRILAIVRQQRSLGWQTCHLTGLPHIDGKRPASMASAESPRFRHSGVPSLESADPAPLHFFRTPPPGKKLERLSLLARVSLLARRLHEVVRLTRPDIIHAHSPVELALAALRVGRRHGIPVVFEVHAPSARAQPGTVWSRMPAPSHGPWRAWADRVLEEWAARRAGAVVTNSEYLRNRLLAAGVRNTRMHFIPDGVGAGTKPGAGSAVVGTMMDKRDTVARSQHARSGWNLDDDMAHRGARDVRRAELQRAGGVTVAVDRHASIGAAPPCPGVEDGDAAWCFAGEEDGPQVRERTAASRWTGERLAIGALHAGELKAEADARCIASTVSTVGTVNTVSNLSTVSIVIGFTVPDCSRSSVAALDTVFEAATVVRAGAPGLRLLAACRESDCAAVAGQAARHGLLQRLVMITLTPAAGPSEHPPVVPLRAGMQCGPYSPAPAPVCFPASERSEAEVEALLNDRARPGSAICHADTLMEQRSMLHRQSDILVFPRAARHPAAAPPRALLAAMADACLVAAADCAPHRAVVDPGRSGVLFPPQDSAALARTLQSLLHSRARWQAMRGAARWCMDFQRDWQANGERYNNLYMKLLEEPR